MKQMLAIYLSTLLLLSIAVPGASEPLNGDFEDQGRSWTTVGDSEAVQFTTDRPAQGRVCLRLSRAEATVGWSVSGPLERLPDGALTLSMHARHVSGAAELAAAFLNQVPQQPQDVTPLWHISLPVDRRWHRVQVGLVVRRGENLPLHLAVGLVGDDGVWQIDNVVIEEYTPPAPASPGPSADIPEAVAPPPLRADWEPEGDLDAVRRRVGNDEEMVVNVNGLDIGITAQTTVARGVRQGLLTYVANRGQTRKQLTVAVQGPPGTFIPRYTVPLVASRTTRFFPPIQMLRTGDSWLRVTLSSGGQSVSLPIRVRCERSYPAFGVTVKEAGDISGRAVDTGASHLPVQFYYLPMVDESVQTLQAALPQAGADIAVHLPWGAQGDLASALTVLRETNIHEKVALAGVDVPEALANGGELVAAVQQAAEHIRYGLPTAAVISPPFSLRAGVTGLGPSQRLDEALSAGLASVVDFLTVQVPLLPGGGVLHERVDGRPRRELSAFWADFDRRFDFAALRTYLHNKGAPLPLLLLEVGASATGDERVDALLATRLIITACARGATGVAVVPTPDGIPAENEASSQVPPLHAAVRELTRELAGTTPLTDFANTEGFSGWQGCPLTYRAFRRVDEGILFMWNNTSAPIDVAVLLDCRPIQLHITRLSYWGDFVTRQFQGLFNFSEEAARNHQSAVYVRVRPLEIVGLTFNLKAAHSGWLRSIAPRPPVPQRRPLKPRDKFLWPKRRL